MSRYRASRATSRRGSHAASGFSRLALTVSLCCCASYADLGTLPSPNDGDAPGTNAGEGDARLSISDCGPGNAAGLEGDRLAAARAGGPLTTDARIVYPLPGALFPGGLAAPIVRWSGPRADAVYLRVRSSAVEYEGCLAASAARWVAVPLTLWSELDARAESAGEPLELELTTVSGASVRGPLRVSFTVSQAPLSGVL